MLNQKRTWSYLELLKEKLLPFPRVTEIIPVKQLITVVFPAPFGPRRQNNWSFSRFNHSPWIKNATFIATHIPKIFNECYDENWEICQCFCCLNIVACREADCRYARWKPCGWCLHLFQVQMLNDKTRKNDHFISRQGSLHLTRKRCTKINYQSTKSTVEVQYQMIYC